MQNVHKIVYINLEKRTDRRVEMEKELQTLGLSGERFQAIHRTPGILGCGLSHLEVLKRARDENWPNVLIFEDDFQLIVDPAVFHQTLETFFTEIKDWDVLMLAYSLEKSKPYNETFGYITEATTASGYLVNQHFYPLLIPVLEEAMRNLERTGEHWHYANDQCWKKLQPKAQWFYTMTRLGIQRASYSDNSYIFMDRGF